MTAAVVTPPYAERVWAKLLFCSDLHPSDRPDPCMVRKAVDDCHHRLAIARCADRYLFEYSEDPEQAAPRMLWCLTAVHEAFASENVR